MKNNVLKWRLRHRVSSRFVYLPTRLHGFTSEGCSNVTQAADYFKCQSSVHCTLTKVLLPCTVCKEPTIGYYGFYLLPLIGPMSNHTRHGFPLYRVQCRAVIDKLPRILCWFSPELLCLVSAFVLWRLEISCKMNLDRTFGTNKNNLDVKRLIFGFFVDVFSRPLYMTSNSKAVSE